MLIGSTCPWLSQGMGLLAIRVTGELMHGNNGLGTATQECSRYRPSDGRSARTFFMTFWLNILSSATRCLMTPRRKKFGNFALTTAYAGKNQQITLGQVCCRQDTQNCHRQRQLYRLALDSPRVWGVIRGGWRSRSVVSV